MFVNFYKKWQMENTMSDCEKYKQFIEDNYMFEFMLWENEILNKQLFNNGNRDIDIDSTTI